MKKNIIFALLILLVFTSCNTLNSTEQLLVGKWYGTSQRNNKGEAFTAEITGTFMEDKSFESSATYIQTDTIGGFENLIRMITLEVKYTGTWDIANQYLRQKYSDVEISVKDIDFIGTDVAHLDIERMKEDCLKLSKQNIPSMKKKMLEPDSARIETLYDHHLVTIGKDGGKVESVRISTE